MQVFDIRKFNCHFKLERLIHNARLLCGHVEWLNCQEGVVNDFVMAEAKPVILELNLILRYEEFYVLHKFLIMAALECSPLFRLFFEVVSY